MCRNSGFWKRTLVGLTAVMVCVGFPGWWLSTQMRQERLNSALVSAIRNNATMNVRSLLAQGSDPNARVEPVRQRTLWEIVLTLFGKPARQPSVASTPLQQMTQGHWGADGSFSGLPENTQMLQALLDAGAERNVQNSDGETPLLMAIACKKHATAMVLILQGADVNIPDHDGQTPFLLELGGGNGEAPELLRMLLGRTTDVNHSEKGGYTALMSAAINGNISIISTLLRRGANVNAQDENGYTPLILASLNDRADVVKMLIGHGADLDLRCCTGDTALSWARRDHCKRAVAILRKVGARE